MHGIPRVLSLLLTITILFYQHEGSVAIEDSAIRNESNDISDSYIGHERKKRRGAFDVDRQLDDHSDHNHDHDDHDDDDKKPYGLVLLTTLMVNCVTLIGIILLIPLMVQRKGRCCNANFWNTTNRTADEEEVGENNKSLKSARVERFLDLIIPSFAGGALLATTVFLIIPEGQAFIQKAVMASHEEEEEDNHADHADEGFEILPGSIVRFGTSILAGYMVPLLLAAVFPKSHEHEHHLLAHKSGDEEDVVVATDDTEDVSPAPNFFSGGSTGGPDTALNLRLIASIIIGDAAHNFCDGIFIGVAFMSCSKTTAFTIVGITIYHEVAQEIADYCLLTKHAGLTTLRALALNFLSGLSVFLGGLIILSLKISDMSIGVILSFSGGVYMYIAASECLPRVEMAVKSVKERLQSVGFFLLGAVPIGLTLLKHDHCDA